MKNKNFDPKKVIDFYTNVYNEDARLKKDRRHIVEYETKKTLILEQIHPGSIVFDIGAGTGVWSEFILDNIKGVKVYAFDLVLEHVRKINARLSEKPGFMGAYVLDILSVDKTLDYQKEFEKADVVMLAGPLYHIKEYTERQSALRHAMGFLNGSETSIIIADWLSGCNAAMETILNHKCCNKVSIGPYNMLCPDKDNMFAYSNERRMEVLGRTLGLQTVRHYALDGISRLVGDKLESLSEEDFKKWLDLSHELATMNKFCDYSEHNSTVYCRIDFNAEEYASQSE